MRSEYKDNDVIECNRLLLINLASKVNQRIIEEDIELEDLGSDEVISFINKVLESEVILDRLLTSANNVYSKGDLERVIYDDEAIEYITDTVRSYLIRTNRLS
jgi:hypothetical protein